MTARIHSAVAHRVAVPAWLLTVVIAAAIAASLFAVLDSPSEPVPVQTQAPALAPTTTCIDYSAVGHC
jgi:hypothetical protein